MRTTTFDGERARTRSTVLLLAGLAALATTGLWAQTTAITGGTVFPVTGPRIDNATILIRDGRVLAVGSGVAVPAGARVVDARGKWITPGLIHANADAGLGVAGLGGFGESSKQGEVNPSFDPLEGFDPEAATLPVARTGGITTAVLGPDGPFLPGHAFAVDYDGTTVDGMLVRRKAAMVLNLTGGSRGAGGGARAGTLARVRQVFDDALELSRRRADYRRDAIQPLAAPAAELEALWPVLRGEMPLVVAANRRMDIENALRLKREYRLDMMLFGATEGWQIAGAIARAGVRVLVEPLQDIPSFDGLRARLDNATLLREAGVEVIIAQNDAGGERNLRYAAGNAVRNGMGWDDALRAVTLGPATAFGLAGYGAIQPGGVANLVVWSGDPFEFSSVAERVFIRGHEASIRTREHELRERYRVLPPVR